MTDESTVPGTHADVRAAERVLAGRVRRTPVMELEAGVLGPCPVLLKLEHTQHTGSFKARGALTALSALADDGRLAEAGVCAASGGNHGLAVAWAAREVGTTATVFVPETAPATKVAGLRALGADVRQVGDRFALSLTAAQEHCERTGAYGVHAYDDPAVLAGQGTVGLELLEQAAQADAGVAAVLVAVGGGGLAGGIAAALDGRWHVVGVEPAGCPTWHAAREAGRPVDVEVGGTAADSLGATRLGQNGFAALRGAGADAVLVDPRDVDAARLLLWQRLRLAVEPGGAVAAAALLSGAYAPAGERVALVLCGGNADPGDLAR